VGLLARESSPVRFELNALGVRLTSASPDLGEAVEAVEAKYEGEEITAAFNPGYLGDGLSGAVSDRVSIELRDGLKPALVRGEEDHSFTYLVMPVRLPAPVG
jgi:DNA polymerase-3 subunit beta